MTDTKKELIVGLFVLTSLAVFAFGIFFFGKMTIKGNYYTLKTTFSDVNNLSIGSPVHVGGVKIGRVNKIYLENERVIVEMLIQKDMQISRKARISVVPKGVIGDMVVSIYNPDISGDEYKEGDIIVGEEPMTMSNFFKKANEFVDKAQETISILQKSGVTDNLNETLKSSKKLVDDTDRLINNLNGSVVTNINESLARVDTILTKIEEALPEKDKINNLIEKFDRGVDNVTKELDGRNKEIKETIVLLNQLLKNIDLLIKNANGVVVDNKEEIADIVENFENVSKKTLTVVENLDKNVDSVAINQSIKDLNEITSEVKIIVKDLKGNLEKIDSKMINDSIKNAEKLSRGLDIMLETKLSFYPEIEMSNEFDVIGNFNLELYNKPTNIFLRTGKRDVNEDWGRWNLIAGKRVGKFDLGLGIVNDKAGLYADYKVNKKISFSADYYDLKKNNIDLYANYWIKDLKLYLRYDINESLYGGIGYRF